MPYVATYVLRKLQRAQNVQPDEVDAALAKRVAMLRNDGWQLEQVSKSLFLGCNRSGFAVAIQAGPKPREFADADSAKRERLKNDRRRR